MYLIVENAGSFKHCKHIVGHTLGSFQFHLCIAYSLLEKWDPFQENINRKCVSYVCGLGILGSNLISRGFCWFFLGSHVLEGGPRRHVYYYGTSTWMNDLWLHGNHSMKTYGTSSNGNEWPVDICVV